MNEPRRLVRKNVTVTRSHGPAKGSRHPEGCACVRCTGFQEGNQLGFTAGHELSTKHGAYSVVGIQGRAREVAEQIAAAMVREDLYRPSFQAAIEACSVVLVRLERAHAAMAKADEALDATAPLAGYAGGEADALARLRYDAAKWAGQARQYLNDLGLTPRSLAAISRDTGIGRSARASVALRALDQHLEREYGPGEVES